MESVIFVRDTFDWLLLIVQGATLIALIVYVIKTWHIASASRKSSEISTKVLEEMKEARIQEMRPNMIAYFDMPSKSNWTYLVIKNIGRSIATDINVSFTPDLKNRKGEKIDGLPDFKKGRESLAPGLEIRTVFDLSFFMMRGQPQQYEAKLTYRWDVWPDRTFSSIHSMDLQAEPGVSSSDKRGMTKIHNHLRMITERFDSLIRVIDRKNTAGSN